MTTNNFTKSDLPRLHHIVQNSAIHYQKELVIATLRDFFSRDVNYHYSTDHWGFPQTPDHTNLPLDAGYHNNITTRLSIVESYRHDVVYYPSVEVKSGGITSVPISFNRETGMVKYEEMLFIDGYGNSKKFFSPAYFFFAGATSGSITIEVKARDNRTRDELTDLIYLLFVDIAFKDLVKSGLVITNVSVGSSNSTLDRNDQLFNQTITLQTRGEWHRHIPVKNVIDTITFAVDFGVIPNGPFPPKLAIVTQETLQDYLASL
jgi:hypothetical protein